MQTSTLDETLVAGGEDRPLAGQPLQARGEHSLGPFLPRKGVGLALSASDIETYRSCPLRYKFARVLRIPTEQTLHQRFGIAVHSVLERFHSDGGEHARAAASSCSTASGAKRASATPSARASCSRWPTPR